MLTAIRAHRRWSIPWNGGVTENFACANPLCNSLQPHRMVDATACMDCGFDGTHGKFLALLADRWARYDETHSKGIL